MTRRQSKADVERLALLLEGDRNAAAEAAGEEHALGSLATLLREAQPEVPPMRAEFRAQLRAEVLEAARAQHAEPALLTRMRERVERFKYSTGLATATGFASVSLAGGGVAGAAEHAAPGDLLYPTKLAIEDARLFVDRDDAVRGRRALSYAAERVDEAGVAAAQGDMDGAETALRSAADRTREGRQSITASGDGAAMLDLVDALTAQSSALAALAPTLTGGAADAADALADEVQAGLDDAGDAFQDPDAGPADPEAPADQGPADPAPSGAQPAPAPASPSAPSVEDAPAAPPATAPTAGPQPELPEIPVPEVELPSVPVPEPAQPAVPAPQPEVDTSATSPAPAPAPAQPGLDALPEVQDVLDQATGQIGDVAGDLTQQIQPPTAAVVPPVAGAVDAVTGAVSTGLSPGGE